MRAASFEVTKSGLIPHSKEFYAAGTGALPQIGEEILNSGRVYHKLTAVTDFTVSVFIPLSGLLQKSHMGPVLNWIPQS